MSDLFWIVLIICISAILIVFTIVFFSEFSVEWVKYRSIMHRLEYLQMYIVCLGNSYSELEKNIRPLLQALGTEKVGYAFFTDFVEELNKNYEEI